MVKKQGLEVRSTGAKSMAQAMLVDEQEKTVE